MAADDSSSDSDGTTSTTRRRVLRTGVAGAVATVGFAAPAAGVGAGDQEALEQLESRYADRSAVDVLDAHGGDLLDLLADRGFLDAPRADALADADAEVRAMNVGAGPTGHVRFETETDEGRLSVNVQPEAGKQYAVLAPEGDDSDEVTVFDPDVEEPTPQCPYLAACVSSSCSVNCSEKYVACCSSYCYTDGQTGGSCLCGNCRDSCNDLCY